MQLVTLNRREPKTIGDNCPVHVIADIFMAGIPGWVVVPMRRCARFHCCIDRTPLFLGGNNVVSQRRQIVSLADFSGYPDNTAAGIDYLGRPLTYGDVDENNVYTVKSGDMSGQIVARYNTTIDNMFVFNPHIRNLSAIYVGQQMLVPFDQQCAAAE